MLIISYIPVVPLQIRCHLLLKKVFLTASLYTYQRSDRPLQVDDTRKKFLRKLELMFTTFFTTPVFHLYL